MLHYKEIFVMQQGTLMAKKSPLPFTLNTHTTYTPKKNAKPKHLVLFADKDGNILGNLDGDYLERATALISHAQLICCRSGRQGLF